MIQYIKNGSVTTVKGFKAAGIHCGIKRKKKDLALLYCDDACTAAAAFTTNKVKAAPVVLSQSIIDKSGKAKAILINSGNANACTGQAGFIDAEKIQSYCAEKLGVSKDEVLISSTGVIGQRLPVDTILKGIDTISAELTEDGGLDCAHAIMTTDTKVKTYAVSVKLSSGEVTIGGMCKGSGMIMPNMATMLGFITTDAELDSATLKYHLLQSVNVTFNKISVDGETSTNDMVIALANGKSGIQVAETGEDAELFQSALLSLCKKMARAIVKDGEGATKLVTINISGAASQQDADLAGKTLANSPLVKTAIYGRDANWGRIMSSVGMSGADVCPEKVSICFDELPILLPGFNIVLNEEKALEVLSQKEIQLNVNLNNGDYSSTWWTCDFTENYVKINADYRT